MKRAKSRLKKSLLLQMTFSVFLGCLAINCTGAENQRYQESIALQGKIGDDSNLVGVERYPGAESNYVWSFAVSPDGSIWIDDPVHRAIKLYSPEGKLVRQIHCDSLIVDDLTAMANSNLAVAFWNSDRICVFDTLGNVLYTCELPHKPYSITYLNSWDNRLFVSFTTCEKEVPEKDWNVGLCYSETGSLLQKRDDSVQLWAATCGYYYTASKTLGDQFSIGWILNRNGQRFATTTDSILFDFGELGIDGARNLYLVQEVGKPNSPQHYYVHKYSPEGSLLSKFEIRDFEVNAPHWTKLDVHGNVYIFWSPYDSEEWQIYKYSISR